VSRSRSRSSAASTRRAFSPRTARSRAFPTSSSTGTSSSAAERRVDPLLESLRCPRARRPPRVHRGRHRRLVACGGSAAVAERPPSVFARAICARGLHSFTR
jgi:hypothetical protein